ncbi:MAG: GTP-binding protein [Ruminococcaceae bacterium]|nr:GTP-binding protein [Oscillospiraceae bacterium]
MTKIDIFSGFLGAGKTTLIKKLLREAYVGEKLVLIENEFGEIGIDGGFMQDAGIEVTEMNSGCICCSLVGDFGKALQKVLDEYHPDRILIEPSGVGKLSDIIRAVQDLDAKDILLNGFTTVADVKKCKMYMKNFGEFFNDQISNAGCIVLSHTQSVTDEKMEETVSLLREKNPTAVIVTTPWDSLDGTALLAAMERRDTIEEELARLAETVHHHHHHSDECEDPDCSCHHHHHDHDEEEHEHHHHHHSDECEDPDCSCHHHHHNHDEEEHGHHHHHHSDECEDPNCSCHHHHHNHGGEGHEHHHHHHADEVFVSYGAETARKFGKEELEEILKALADEKYGAVLRAKGIVPCKCGAWLHFDYVPEEGDVRKGSAAITGRLCVIGSKLNRAALSELFGVDLK